MTVRDLIKRSLRLIGVIAAGETPDDDEMGDAMVSLNALLGSWVNEKLLTLTDDQVFSAVAGTAAYTVGPTMVWNGRKPIKIQSATVTDINGKTYPLKEYTYDEYIKIFDKITQSDPWAFAYLPSNTTGTFFLYPAPNAAYSVKLLSQKAFTKYTSLSTIIELPEGYENALTYSLAVELIPEYPGIDISPQVMKKAAELVVALKKTNLKKAPFVQYDKIFSRGRCGSVESGRAL